MKEAKVVRVHDQQLDRLDMAEEVGGCGQARFILHDDPEHCAWGNLLNRPTRDHRA